MAASLTIQKFYVDADGNYYDAEGNMLEGETAFYEATKDVTEYLSMSFTTGGNDYTVASAQAVWESEIIAQFGEDYTPAQANEAVHANAYELQIYFDPSAMNDPDFDFAEPALMGTHNIFIGVKGDYDMDNNVTALDANYVLTYFLEKTVTQNPDAAIINDDVNLHASDALLERYRDDLDTEEGLIFYLTNVEYQEDPLTLMASDAQFILNYFMENYVVMNGTTWEAEVGYDLNLDAGFDWDESNSDRSAG
ncbi:MAG TPA: hypothetical protein DCG49_10910 [Ruminococcus sp.]|nr:hypothetical protein [Ruminococcus sp.]